MSASGSSALGDVDSFLKSVWGCDRRYFVGKLAGSKVTSSEEVCPSGPITLYGFWIERMYTVPVSVGWRRHYPPTFRNDGIGGCKLLFMSPVLHRLVNVRFSVMVSSPFDL
ncbi:unnamed protein product [Brassica rapa subsp. narinosa]